MRWAIFSAAALILAPTVAAAQNLVQNGDFSQGYSSFSSDYTKAAATNGTVFTTPPAFGVISNAATAFSNGYLSHGDHTTGSGLMLFFDGAGPSLDVWRQTLSLAANTNYIFSYYASTPDGGQLSGNDFGDLQFKLNGVGLADSIVTGQGGNAWQLISESFKTSTAGQYTLAISDLNGTAFQNDDVIDDISLRAGQSSALPEPFSWVAFVLGFGLLGVFMRRVRSAPSGLAKRFFEVSEPS